jgi:hypothetical protein
MRDEAGEQRHQAGQQRLDVPGRTAVVDEPEPYLPLVHKQQLEVERGTGRVPGAGGCDGAYVGCEMRVVVDGHLHRSLVDTHNHLGPPGQPAQVRTERTEHDRGRLHRQFGGEAANIGGGFGRHAGLGRSHSAVVRTHPGGPGARPAEHSGGGEPPRPIRQHPPLPPTRFAKRNASLTRCCFSF